MAAETGVRRLESGGGSALSNVQLLPFLIQANPQTPNPKPFGAEPPNPKPFGAEHPTLNLNPLGPNPQTPNPLGPNPPP